MSDLHAKLSGEIMTVDWDMLALHQRRGALFLVAPELSLLDVALAVAEDRASDVQAWLAAGQLARPTDDQVRGFEATPAPFRFVIVQPFVLAQLEPPPPSLPN